MREERKLKPHPMSPPPHKKKWGKTRRGWLSPYSWCSVPRLCEFQEAGAIRPRQLGFTVLQKSIPGLLLASDASLKNGHRAASQQAKIDTQVR